MPAFFRRAAILGTGLIGGSFALALRQFAPDIVVAGWDKPDVLAEARKRGAIQEAAQDIGSAVAGADLVYVAFPVQSAIEALPKIAHHASPNALVTDACSTKRSICAAAGNCFRAEGARFLAGHPMAGKEVSGISAADAELFRGAKYALIREPERENEQKSDRRVTEFVSLIERIGAEPVWLNAEIHDCAAALVSHLPQLLTVALAGVVRTHTDAAGFPVTLAGRGLRDALRLAGSPYSVWRDILLTNSDQVDESLGELIESLQRMRNEIQNASSQNGVLEKDFAASGELYKILRDLKLK